MKSRIRYMYVGLLLKLEECNVDYTVYMAEQIHIHHQLHKKLDFYGKIPLNKIKSEQSVGQTAEGRVSILNFNTRAVNRPRLVIMITHCTD